MKKLFSPFLFLALSVAIQAATPVRKQLFDADWSFSLDSIEWRPVSLPHDWSIEGVFDKEAPAGNDGAYLPTGRGWYRKTFYVESLAFEEGLKDAGMENGKVMRLYFEGVYMNSDVYVNGHRAGGHPYGYSSFFVDMTPFIKKGNNVVEVCVDNSRQKNCRWYSGSGIYRHVWLLTTGRRYIDEWSVRVTTRDMQTNKDSGRKLDGETVEHSHGETVHIEAEVVVEDGLRKPIEKTLRIENPRLWSPDDPYLYTTTIEAEGDRLPVTFGIRSIEYSAEKGLLLNGQPIVLNGGCVHHDNGILGAAAFDAAEYRRVKLLKEAGFNAVRTSHNPPSEAFLRACDELGMLVIDEVFDGWREKKNDHDYSTLIDRWWEEDVRAMVLRDRNHPSVFCWSTGNEVIERKKIEVVKTAHQLATLCRELDGQHRPVTSALCAWDSDWDIYDPLAAEHDIVGYNYMIHKSQSDHARVPHRVMMQTESYPRDAWQNHRKVAENAYVIGDFVWTAMDYLGESGIGRWYYEGDTPGEHWVQPLFPWHASYCGDIDLIGMRKPISHYRSLLWGLKTEPLYMAVREPDGYNGVIKTTMWGTWPTFESWTWPGHEGKPIQVEVYTRAPKVQLFLNDHLIGEELVKECKALFTLPYQAGTLRAEAGGEHVVLKTASAPKSIRLSADRTTLCADGQDLAFITVELTDAKGCLNPNAADELTATVTGPASMVAFGNADIKDCDRLTDNRHRAWKGRALLVVRSTGKKGTVTVSVQGKGLKAAEIKLKTQAGDSTGKPSSTDVGKWY
ncbi:MAG: DUF4982 domain-containing protein [Bacteroidaceae bacterium]|nr:DUF4982 domain-containing protein [Bacteroidaceae bacterium]